jgi:hypothetical protein
LGKLMALALTLVGAACNSVHPPPSCDAGPYVVGDGTDSTHTGCANTPYCYYRHADTISGDPDSMWASECSSICSGAQICQAGDSPDGGYLVACMYVGQGCRS